ncbi:MAG: MFS transporter [Gammaproteobacteria bacterium]|nr:MFS transporter [Gammaproteobacteria bacterium]
MNSTKTYSRIGYFIVALGALFYCYEYFLRIMPSVMKPELMSTFSVNATLFGTLSAFYFYAYTPMQTVVGIMVDRYRIKYVLSFAILCCVAGTFMMAKTDSYTIAACGRFLQGFGSAFAFVGALKLTALWLPTDRFAFYSGFTNMLGFLGAAFGEIFLVNVVKTIGWRSTLDIFAIIGLILLSIVWLALSKTPPIAETLTEEQTISFKDALKQLLNIVKQPYIWAAGILAYLIFLPTDVFAGLWGIPYLEKLHHYTAQQAGIASAMIFLGWAIGAPMQGWLSDRFNNRLTVIAIGSLCAAIIAVITLYTDSLEFIPLCVLFVIFGICSSVEILTFAMARDAATRQTTGMAIAFVNTLCMMGGLIFQREIGALLDKSWSGQMINGLRDYSVTDYQHALLVIPISLFLACLIAIIAQKKITLTRV